MGLVKNRARNGDHYWVNAYVTPILDAQGNLIEYQSVRTAPERDDIQRAERFYQTLNSGKVPRARRNTGHQHPDQATTVVDPDTAAGRAVCASPVLAYPRWVVCCCNWPHQLVEPPISSGWRAAREQMITDVTALRSVYRKK